MKTISTPASQIQRGNIIDDKGLTCHVLRTRSDGPVASEFLLMPFGCMEQGTMRYSYPFNQQMITRYVASEVSK